jgi:hypothetical protein
VRYALEPMIKRGSTGMLEFLAGQHAEAKVKREEEIKKLSVYG